MALVQWYGHGDTDSTGLFNTTASSATFNTGQTFSSANAVIVLSEFFAGVNTDNIVSLTVSGTSCTKLAEADAAGAAKASIWWCATNAGDSDAVVATFAGAVGQKAGLLSVLEWSNITGLDTGCENSGEQAASTAPTISTAIPTTTSSELLVSVSGSSETGSTTYVEPSSWTLVGKIQNGATYDVGGTAYLQDDAAAATKTATWTQTNSTTSSNCIAAFKLGFSDPRLMGQACL